MQNKKVICLAISFSLLTSSTMYPFSLADIKNKIKNIFSKTAESIGSLTKKIEGLDELDEKRLQEIKRKAMIIAGSAFAIASIVIATYKLSKKTRKIAQNTLILASILRKTAGPIAGITVGAAILIPFLAILFFKWKKKKNKPINPELNKSKIIKLAQMEKESLDLENLQQPKNYTKEQILIAYCIRGRKAIKQQTTREENKKYEKDFKKINTIIELQTNQLGIQEKDLLKRAKCKKQDIRKANLVTEIINELEEKEKKEKEEEENKKENERKFINEFQENVVRKSFTEVE